MRRNARPTNGMTMIEMVVTLAIISIVSMGLMALLWVDSWWIFKLSNKTDNVIAAQQFLDRFASEVSVAQSINPSSDAQNLSVQVPVFESDRIGSAQYLGFPLQSADTLIYKVQKSAIQDPSVQPQYEIVRSVVLGSVPMPFHPEDGRKSITSATILTGIIGPLDLSGNPKIFTYTTNGVMANVEMSRFLPNNRAADPLSFGTQVFTRNSNIFR